MQMSDGHFRTVRSHPGFNLRREQNVRFVDHTAVVEKVVGDKMHVFEQNTQVGKTVVESVFDLRDMVRGTVSVFRPVGQSQRPQLRGMCQKW